MKKYFWIGLLAAVGIIALLLFKFTSIFGSQQETKDDVVVEAEDEIVVLDEEPIERITKEKNNPEMLIKKDDQQDSDDERKKSIIENLRKNRENPADPCDDIKCYLGSICVEGACELLVDNEPKGMCGNFVVDEAEICDRGTLCTDTCECPNGLIGCEGGCAEPGYCMPKLCGNDVVNEAEECDGGGLCTQYCECPEGLIGCEGGCAQAGYCL